MQEFIWLLPSFPLAGFLILVLTSGTLSRITVAVIGAGSIGLSFLVASIIAVQFLGSGDDYYIKEVWAWMSVGGFSPGFSFYLDGLSLVMMLIITGVGFLIHLYATGYMADDPSYSRFFSYMNLFIAAMLMLVLGDNLVLLYLGWEGVGLCSYLLIGFWYTKPENGYAARKAFVVTRVGDTSMAIGLFLLFAQLGTLNIQDMLHVAEVEWNIGSGLAIATTMLLLGGAVGKSAQLPLQTWLPDAMAGPTPISALIHAATMVTAGVYLIARTHVLFQLAPSVQLLVAWIGLITLLMAGFTALTQSDIKRILAFSTVSQIGYMFLGLGVGAWSAAIFHLMTHAFFKALLFLASGTVILSMHHEQSIFKMGGLRKALPVSFASFLIGSLALTAFPYTSGYFSKDEILLAALELDGPGIFLWAGGVLGAFFTGIYTFRLFFVVFFGETSGHPPEKEVGGWHMNGPLIVLMVLSIFGGFISIPVDAVFGHGESHEEHHVSALVHGFMVAVPLLGILVSYLCFHKKVFSIEKLMSYSISRRLHKFWHSGWGMDWLYDRVFVFPFLWLSRINHADLVDRFYGLIVEVSKSANKMVVKSQTGYLRWYAFIMALGLVALLLLGIIL
ncbi:MAG: NADH-quinone oxidoreductase subunit L [Gammaproteobacteria bacterium]|nr:NADH-quinone oxidoreductase subunit L [Gammaproteobacteria bacterium]